MTIRNFNKLFIAVLVIALITGTAFSQTKEIDSLKTALVNVKEDSDKVHTLLLIGGNLNEANNFALAEKYIDSGLLLARKIKLPVQEFNALSLLAQVYFMQPKTTEQLKVALAALSVAKKITSKNMIAEGYIAVTYAYQKMENFPEAINNAYAALKLYEELNDNFNIANTWMAIGRVYSRQQNPKEMSRCFTKALSLFKEDQEKHKDEIAGCNHFIARAEMLQQHYGTAINLFNDVIKFLRATGQNTTWVSGAFAHLAISYKGLGDSARAAGNGAMAKQLYAKALTMQFESMNHRREIGDSSKSAAMYQILGDIYIRLKKFPLARKYLDEALLLCKEEQSKNTYKETYQSLFSLDSAEGNYRQAFEHYKLFTIYKDSIAIEESFKTVENQTLQFEFDKKEDSLKQIQLITETKLQAEKKQKYFYWGGLGLLALLSFFVFRNFRNQKKINRLAAEAYANERAELELQSLRAQLNPHFIFNCINSIDAFIHNNDKYNATIYLNKFARLLRNILDSSKLTTVSFPKDIDTLKLYVELEELRHENKFKTVFSIEDELLNNDYKVPALIIQPFVENAILHGLKNREDNNGLLLIEIKRNADKIEYSIKDNGIGRKAAGMIAQNKESSYGMQMSNDRIKLFNREEKPSVQINDLYKDNIAIGTEVKVLLNIN